MLTGHESHQLGIEADVWLTPMPDRRLSASERDEMPATNLVAESGDDVDPRVWRPEHRKLLEAAARSTGVGRIFVNAAIKRALCREAGAARPTLAGGRPARGLRRPGRTVGWVEQRETHRLAARVRGFARLNPSYG